ncbi:hypothetical protein LDL08_09350 [Nonomuraea glycinis]|uniref:hypothetical protein n=1 Tax=Nonomuraea glycinis TaxID=2047744 RepID=UPI001666726B|nr:hypothetical protein [Nonomuraea glycinis]MCA2176387.1 hypothetical protein [Nonomuraea glycinis]
MNLEPPTPQNNEPPEPETVNVRSAEALDGAAGEPGAGDLRPGDPERVGGYRLTGRLHVSCCDVVDYLAVAPSGRTVVLRRYGRPADRRPADPGWAERMRQAAPVGTVAVLDSGADFVVTEHVEGGSLAGQAAAEPPAESALRRLAIGTVTALAAVHRAGLAPAGIRPSRVLLGPDGPRLLCAVPEIHDQVGGSHDTSPIRLDQPAWPAPEQLRTGTDADLDPHRPARRARATGSTHPSGTARTTARLRTNDQAKAAQAEAEAEAADRAGMAVDVYCWAATIAYAAAGRDPFAADSEAQRLARMAEGAASLAAVPQGGVRDLLADCLADSPTARPTAEEALLRLVEETGLAAPPDLATPPKPPRRPGRALLITAAGVTIALIAGGTSAALTLAAAPEPTPKPTVAAPTASWSARSVSPLPTPPANGTELTLPGGLGTAYENPADPVRLTSFRVDESRRYVRDPRTGAFNDVGPHTVAAEQSPDGRWLASFNSLYAATDDHLAVSFVDRLTGARFSVPALGPPYQSLTLSWSRDSRRVLLTAQRIEQVDGEDVPLTAGYVIVDVAARTARFVPTGDGDEVKQAAKASGGRVKPIEHHAEYRWTPDGRSVISSFLTAEWGQGVRIRDADSGRAIRMMHWTGEVQGMADWFSPSGGKFVTGGCAKILSACVWKTADASRLHNVTLLKGAGFYGWYDENHLIIAASVQKGQRGIFVTDMSGKPVRVLAMIKAADDVVVDVRYTRG